jgi:two-component system sensor histidine kinase KdpD
LRCFWRQSRPAAVSSLAIALLTLISYRLHINNATIVLSFLFVLVLQSLTGGAIASAIVAAVAAGCLDFFFLPPPFSFRVDNAVDAWALLVFPMAAFVITKQVSRVRTEADRARRHGAEVEQLYAVASRLLVLKPDQAGGVPEVFRDVLASAAVCLFDASTAELSIDGISRHDLAERTRQAYIFGKDADDAARGVYVRCLRVGSATTGAIGFEFLSPPETISPAFPVLAAAALERVTTFRLASHETAAAQAEVFRAAILDALAHEFKTPLATILVLIGGIRESLGVNSEKEEMAGMIESEVSRLSRLTTRLLRTARLDREEMKPRLETIDFVPFVERIVQRYTGQSHERRVTVTSRCGAVEVPADRQLLDLALTQLVDNAFKYSPPASAITVSVQAERGFITTSVGNVGNAITPDEGDRIFERFYRGAKVRNLVSGTGLGLYVARKIAGAHGGSLSFIRDGASEGVVFCLKLPISKQDYERATANHSHSARG